MATRVRLYYTERNTDKWELLANKLLIVEDIEAYLNTKTFLNITNFQYIKNELELAINVQIEQRYAQPKTNINFKYVAIQNENEFIHYYFVKKAYWRSKDCVRFELVMDVLNTFQEGQDYSFKATTKITREHKDRFVLDESFEATFNIQIIDYEGTISEGDMVAIVDEDVLLEGVVVALGAHSITLGNLNKTPAQIREDIPVPSEYRIAKTPDIYILADIDSIEFEGSYFRNIDYISENINPVLENVDRKIITNPVTLLEQDWYLLYRNQEDPDQSLVNPVDCYLIPNNAGLQVDAGAILGGRLIPSFIEDNKYYYFRVDSGQTYTLSNGQSISYSSNPNKYVIVTKVDNKINVIFAEVLVSSSGSILTIVGNYDVDYMTITSLPAYYAKLNGGNFSALILNNLSYNNVFENTLTYNTLDDITKLDRTDAKNIKLIKLPYCPYNFSIVNDVLKIDQEADWELSSITQANGGIIYALKLLKLNKKLSNNFNSFPNPLLNLSSSLPNNAAITDLRITNLDIESKLFHSDFRRDTFVYDSFSWTLPLEKLSLTYYITGSRIFNIKFNTTSTINSKFMFTFTPFVSTKAIENFPNVLTIARNNEEVLYNVHYINYIRTG